MHRLLVFFAAAILSAQTSANPPDWTRPMEPHRVIGNIYYVGTYDLACFLITSPEGHVLINSGVDGSAALIRTSVEKLGFKWSDIKTLLTMQAHWDHVAGLAEIQRETKARLLATEGDAMVLRDGGKSDFHFGDSGGFQPVPVAGLLKDGEVISVGASRLVVHIHPGHTKGSASYSMEINEGGKNHTACMANMGSINPGVKLMGNAKYPQIAADYARSFAAQKAAKCDIFLSAHASQYDLHSKWKPGQAYSPLTFVDPKGYKAAVESYEEKYKKQLAEEKK